MFREKEDRREGRPGRETERKGEGEEEDRKGGEAGSWVMERRGTQKEASSECQEHINGSLRDPRGCHVDMPPGPVPPAALPRADTLTLRLEGSNTAHTVLNYRSIRERERETRIIIL